LIAGTNCRKIVGGHATGAALITNERINFLSMINQKNGTIEDNRHELFGSAVKNTVLIFPGSIGSSVGAYSIFSLKMNLSAPAAIICMGKADIVTASGCAISNIPLVDMLENTLYIIIKPGMQVNVDANNGLVSIRNLTV
jgi:uncharacterized protein